MSDLKGRCALVAGGSRGIGADVARQLSGLGCRTILTYNKRAKHAEAVAEEIAAAGGDARTLQLNICDAESRAKLIAAVGSQFERLDYLILSASGGLEPGAPPSYAHTLNTLGPLRLVQDFWLLLAGRGVVVYLTSHGAHFWDSAEPYPPYALVAQSKKNGEMALVAQTGRMRDHGVTLKIVSADIVEGTATTKLLERLDPGLLASHRTKAGRLPTTVDVARNVVERCNDSSASGSVSFVWEPGNRYLAADRRV